MEKDRLGLGFGAYEIWERIEAEDSFFLGNRTAQFVLNSFQVHVKIRKMTNYAAVILDFEIRQLYTDDRNEFREKNQLFTWLYTSEVLQEKHAADISYSLQAQ
jgi:hypothetical protein